MHTRRIWLTFCLFSQNIAYEIKREISVGIICSVISLLLYIILLIFHTYLKKSKCSKTNRLLPLSCLIGYLTWNSLYRVQASECME